MNPTGSGPRDPWTPNDGRSDGGGTPSQHEGQGYGTGHGSSYGSGGYQPWQPTPPPAPQGSPILKVLAMLGVLALLGMGACGACVYLGYRAISGAMSDQVADSLRGNPVLAENIGEIESIELDLIASGSEAQEDVFVFDVTGTLGSGRLVVQTRTTDFDTEEVLSGRLEMADGQLHDLFPAGAPKIDAAAVDIDGAVGPKK